MIIIMYEGRTHGWLFLVKFGSSWLSHWAAVIPRPCRRFLITLCFLTLIILFLSGPMTLFYTYIVDFYLPSFTMPIKRDLSQLPVIQDQLTFIPRVVEPTSRKDHTFMLILVSSAAAGEDHVRKRMAIRKTWGKIPPGTNPWRLAFFLGATNTQLVDSQRMEEAKTFGDMLIGDFPDTYRNITKKLMMAFKWASEQQFEYLLKTDDDVYINVPSLIQWINDTGSLRSPLYAGVLYRGYVQRDPRHRHYITWNDLPDKFYPWYPKGALYVLSGDVVKQMITLSTKVKQITVDDAYIGIMASYLGIQPIALPHFIQSSLMPGYIEYFDKCTYMNIFGMADNLSPSDIYFVHQQVLLARNSSKWLCIHVNHPLILAALVMIIIIVFWAVLIRRTSAHIKQ